MTIIFNAEIQIQYFCYFSFGVSILFWSSFLNGLSQTDAVCGISSEIQSSFRISLIFIQICYSKQSYCYKCLSIYLSRYYIRTCCYIKFPLLKRLELLIWKKSQSQSSTFCHIPEKLGFYFLMGKLSISIERMVPQTKVKG